MVKISNGRSFDSSVLPTRLESIMGRPVLPNSFVWVGQAGTTSLFHYLRQHPEIHMSPIKEPCYFASEIRPENLGLPFKRHVQRMSRNRNAVDGSPITPMGWLVTEWEEYLKLFANRRHE